MIIAETSGTEMKRVTINECFGGFNLTEEYLDWLNVSRGEEQESIQDAYDDRHEVREMISHTFSDFGKYILTLSKYNGGRDNKFNDFLDGLCKDGEKDNYEAIGLHMASGFSCRLTIINVPNHIPYVISEYDGYEKIQYLI